MTLASSAVVGAHLRFGEFELAPAARALWRSGAPVKLGSRALDILIALASRPGEILSKDELTEIVWRGTHVEETGVRVGISNLRKALGQSGERYVTTVPGRGYCFVLEVSATTTGRAPEGRDKAWLKPQRLPGQIARVVGRDGVVDILIEALARHRLLSIVGPGGIGKTTVALAVAARASGAFDTIAFVDLSPIRDGHQLSSGVAAALGLNLRLRQDPIEEMAAAVEGQRVLVLLDNCEHLVDPVAGFVEDLLGRAPGVTALATTRELLRATGEWVHQLAPLEVPPIASTLSADEARGYSAAAMFEDRAALALGGYELDDADAPYVAEICRRLDGIALAIELAAGRLASLGIQGLAVSLEDCFRILTHGRRTALPRHQTLRATFDWSYQLLSPEDQAALRRLSVFSGNITLEDAAAVIEGDRRGIDAADRVASLVDRSLVVASLSERAPRYRLLETTRAYAQERLAETGEADLYRRRHAEHVRAAFDSAQAEWGGRPVRDWLQAYCGQLGNLRAALDWAFSPEGEGAIGAALTAAAAPLWFHLSLLDEGMARVERAIAWTKDQSNLDRRLMLQLYAVSNWPRVQAIGGTPGAAAAREENLALAVELEDVDHQLQAIWALILACANRGAAAEALAQADRFAALAPQASDPQDQVIARRLRGKSLHFTGDFADSRSETERMLDLYQPRPSHLVRFQYDQRLIAQIIVARNLWLQGYADQALVLVEQMIADAQALDHTLTLGAVVCDAACFIALWVGDMALAARYTDMLKAHTAPAYRGWHSLGDACEGEILIRQGHAEAGVARVGQAIASLRAGPFCIYNSAIEGVLAEGLLASGRTGDARETVAQALARSRGAGEGWCLAELMRIQALTLAASGLSTQAVDVLAEGLELARTQGALAWELRLATTLAGIEHSLTAQAGLREVLGRIQEGFGTCDYRTALARLDR
jgi:predicted ATPase/DNA-binding winged helix-turn-helix (wHTH) protein